MQEGYELHAVDPPDDYVLQKGDIYEVTWDLFQTGTWFLSANVARVEAAFSADGRVELAGYGYDPDAKTITFKVHVVDDKVGGSTVPSLAAAFGPAGLVVALTVAAVVGLILGSTWAFVYDRTRRAKLYRKAPKPVQEVIADPTTAPEVKEVLERGMEAEQTSFSEALSNSASAVIFVAVVVLILKVFKR